VLHRHLTYTSHLLLPAGVLILHINIRCVVVVIFLMLLLLSLCSFSLRWP